MGARFALARQQGVTEDLIEALPHYDESGLFDAKDKAAIRFAAILAGDHRTASQELFDTLRVHFSEPEILELGWRIVTFVGYGRLIHALGLEIGKTCPLHGEETKGSDRAAVA